MHFPSSWISAFPYNGTRIRSDIAEVLMVEVLNKKNATEQQPSEVKSVDLLTLILPFICLFAFSVVLFFLGVLRNCTKMATRNSQSTPQINVIEPSKSMEYQEEPFDVIDFYY